MSDDGKYIYIYIPTHTYIYIIYVYVGFEVYCIYTHWHNNHNF